MKVNENLSVLFLLEKSKTSQDGKAPITARLTIDGKRAEFSLGQKIYPHLWDQDTEKVIITNNPDKESARLINDAIVDCILQLKTHYFILSRQYEKVTAPLLKMSYKGELNVPKVKEPEKERTLCQVFNFKYSIFARQVKCKKRAGSTLKKWKTTKRKIREFLYFKFKKWDVSLSAIQYSDADDFMNYLVLHHNIEENTARKYLKNTKHLLQIASERQWAPSNMWLTYRVGYDQPNREYLTLFEILKIYNKPLINRLDHVRNIFLFACFTGYGFQEVLELSRDDLFIGNDGKRWIVIERQKTNNPEGIPLLPIPSAIVDKYENDAYCIANNRLLPVKSYHNYNGYLKEIADLCGITKNLSTHIARHTFATTICLDHGMPIATVSKLLGHRNIRTTQIYGKVTNKNISDNMAEIQEKIFNDAGELKFVEVPVITLKRLMEGKALAV